MHAAFLTYRNIFRTAPRHKLINYLLLPPFYAVAVTYASLRIWQAFGMWLYFPVYAGACAALIALGPAALLCFGLPGYSRWQKRITMVGTVWTAALMYGMFFSWVLELVRLLDRLAGRPVALFLERTAGLPALTLVSMLVLATLAVFLIVSIYNAAVPRVRRYTVKVPHLSQALKLVLLSDAHLTNLTSPVRLGKLCRRVGSLESDAVLLAGDIVDNRLDIIRQQRIAERLSAIRSRYGVFYAPGNHEYIHAARACRSPDNETDADFHDKVAELLSYFKSAGIHVLSDEKISLGGLCTLAGRRDRDMVKHTDQHRTPLSSVLAGSDPALPVVVLDHQTEFFEEAQEAGVDLLLSGHTHRGQVFPLTLFSHLRYAHNYGRYQEQGLTHIVSAGCGSWGPPIRLGSRAEIVLITLCA